MLYSVLIIILILLPSITPAAWQGDEAIPENHIEVSFEIPASLITGISRITVRKGQPVTLQKGSLEILHIKQDEQSIDFSEASGVITIIPPEDGTVEIKYKGLFNGSDQNRDRYTGPIEDIIDERGISLTGIWYPRPAGLCRYYLKVTLPAGYEAISEAEDIKRAKLNSAVQFSFEFPYPLDGISLIATDRFRIIEDSVDGIRIFAYFLEGDTGLAERYISFTKKYLRFYEDLIGRYPYKRFSIVENFLPTGYSMPTFTLLGQTVVRLPFIVETSLGHEILHQWFGNHVYVDYEKGNWSEGLTTYLADHLFEEQKGREWRYRKQMLIDYESYVRPENELSLRDFRGRYDRASRAIGYGKASLVFHMLRNVMGEEAFVRALKDFVGRNRFRMASWDDLKRSFENIYGRRLDRFFRQWIDEEGIPELRLSDVKMDYTEGGFRLSFSILQEGRIYIMDVPVTLYTDGRGIKRFFRIDKKRNNFTIFMSEPPERIVIDEDYDIARRLTEEEIPPVIGMLLGDREQILVLPAEKGRYKDLIKYFKKDDITIKKSIDISHSEIKSSSLIILGLDNPLISRLFGRIDLPEAGFSVDIRKNPWNPGKVIGIFDGRSRQEIKAAFRKIPHYGRYSRVLFNNGISILKETKKSKRGIEKILMREIPVIDVSAIKGLSEIIEDVADRKIIYIGESHEVFAHHLVQLEVIRRLYERNPKIAIGMEMFQRPFQEVLDHYIEGNIKEREFLKRSEYFRRWGYDYNLYKPILDFARAKRIPVIALNIRREIIDKVSEKGMGSLSKKERKEIPPSMDFSDTDYRERLFKIFKQHKDSEKKNFDYFYQSQILWDETMAWSIDQFIRKNPHYQVVVLAGQGHLEYGSGIPSRVFRRNGHDYAIILTDSKVRQGIASYIVFPGYVKSITSPKLMVFLREEEGRLKITGFPEGSVSEKAGLKKGDIILSMDGVRVKDVADIRLQLFYKQKGDTVKVRVLRNDREMEFEVNML